MEFCPHSSALKLPLGHTKIYKDECTLCFSTNIKICAACYDGSCQNHSELHYNKTRHGIYIEIQKTKKENKIQKLEIKKEEFILEVFVECKTCRKTLELEAIKDAKLLKIIQAVIDATSPKDQSQIKSWEQEMVPCRHTKELIQDQPKSLDMKCFNCDLKENMWACLTCGNLGCGRAQFGGVGGNGHGLKHFEAFNHPVAVKLGTITQDGKADVFCYACGEERLDENLAQHLKNFGVLLESVQKTEKSLGEMQLEQNLKFDFSMTTQDGKNLVPLFGPGYTGLKNLGNSCYLASIVQVLFSIPSFYSTYYNSNHHISCNLLHADCFHCQMEKMANGLLSGSYCIPAGEENDDKRGQDGVTPFMFKDLIAKGNDEFSSMRQQDAQEFLQHILTLVEQKEKRFGIDPTSVFKFKLEQKLQCLKCSKVRYRNESTSMLSLVIPAVKSGNLLENGKPEYLPVDFDSVLERFFGVDLREFYCPFDNQKTEAGFTSRFYTFPDVLVCSLSRFTLGEGWVMEKLNVDVNIPEFLDLSKYISAGKCDAEQVLPDESNEKSAVEVDAVAMEQLMSMGFSEIRCTKALLATGNQGSETAMNWLFEHMDDPDIDQPISSGTETQNSEDINQLMNMGFSDKQAKKALRETGNNIERAVDWLFSHADEPIEDEAMETVEPSEEIIDPKHVGSSKYRLFAFVSHKGSSANCGHYVSFIFKNDKWAIFNDNKVAQVDDISKHIKEGYLYFFKKEN